MMPLMHKQARSICRKQTVRKALTEAFVVVTSGLLLLQFEAQPRWHITLCGAC